jgi:hypothetical protein
MASRKSKKPTKKPPLKRSRARKRANARAKPSRAQSAFVKGLIARGEAAEPDASGKLPPEATHVIIDTPDGPVVKRARFTLA